MHVNGDSTPQIRARSAEVTSRGHIHPVFRGGTNLRRGLKAMDNDLGAGFVEKSDQGHSPRQRGLTLPDRQADAVESHVIRLKFQNVFENIFPVDTGGGVHSQAIPAPPVVS